MTRHRTSRARPLKALAVLAAALAIVATTSLAGAAPASADDGPYPAPPTDDGDPHCIHPRGSNACLSMDWHSFYEGDADVGIDAYMPEQYGREILACGADFRASLWGDDDARGPSSGDDLIRNLKLQPGWPIADSTGIAAEFISPNIQRFELDEDDDGEDQIYARVSFYDCHTDKTRNFTTGYLYAYAY